MDRKLGQIFGERFSPAFRAMQENDPYRIDPRTMVSCQRKSQGPHRFRVTNCPMRQQPYKEWAFEAQNPIEVRAKYRSTSLYSSGNDSLCGVRHVDRSFLERTLRQSDRLCFKRAVSHRERSCLKCGVRHAERSFLERTLRQPDRLCLKCGVRHREHVWLNCNWPCPCTGIRSHRERSIPRGG